MATSSMSKIQSSKKTAQNDQPRLQSLHSIPWHALIKTARAAFRCMRAGLQAVTERTCAVRTVPVFAVHQASQPRRNLMCCTRYLIVTSNEGVAFAQPRQQRQLLRHPDWSLYLRIHLQVIICFPRHLAPQIMLCFVEKVIFTSSVPFLIQQVGDPSFLIKTDRRWGKRQAP